MEQLMKKGLDGTQLKTVALVLMVLDHIHYFFEFTGWVPIWFNMLGRLSAPLFLFCTVEGFAHTHDRKRYVLRIWALPPFCAGPIWSWPFCWFSPKCRICPLPLRWWRS